jgi:hypothetical protein
MFKTWNLLLVSSQSGASFSDLQEITWLYIGKLSFIVTIKHPARKTIPASRRENPNAHFFSIIDSIPNSSGTRKENNVRTVTSTFPLATFRNP